MAMAGLDLVDRNILDMSSHPCTGRLTYITSLALNYAGSLILVTIAGRILIRSVQRDLISVKPHHREYLTTDLGRLRYTLRGNQNPYFSRGFAMLENNLEKGLKQSYTITQKCLSSKKY